MKVEKHYSRSERMGSKWDLWPRPLSGRWGIGKLPGRANSTPEPTDTRKILPLQLLVSQSTPCFLDPHCAKKTNGIPLTLAWNHNLRITHWSRSTENSSFPSGGCMQMEQKPNCTYTLFCFLKLSSGASSGHSLNHGMLGKEGIIFINHTIKKG